MAKYVPVYKCGICNKLIPNGEAKEVSPEKLPLFANIKSRFQKIDNPFLHTPEHCVHSCENGAVGVAVFVGFVPEDFIK